MHSSLNVSVLQIKITQYVETEMKANGMLFYYWSLSLHTFRQIMKTVSAQTVM
jgi:hypothetical protein